MNVLIIAPTRQEFDETVASYDERLRKTHEFIHITKREDMLGYAMPVQIRFVGRWWELPEAPSLEWYAEHIIRAPVEGTNGL